MTVRILQTSAVSSSTPKEVHMFTSIMKRWGWVAVAASLALGGHALAQSGGAQGGGAQPQGGGAQGGNAQQQGGDAQGGGTQQQGGMEQDRAQGNQRDTKKSPRERH